MTTLQLAYNATTKEAKIQMPGDAPGAGFTDLGDFHHPMPSDELGPDVSHVLWHHAQDLLYRVADEQNMQAVKFTYKRVTGISTLPATVTLAAAATQQLTTTFTPADAANRTLTYATSDATKATVSATGLITAVATGTATITVTSVDGGFTDTCVVTIS